MAKIAVVSQTAKKTVIKCPKCKSLIDLLHAADNRMNDDIGRLDLGLQNYTYVVCSKRSCDWAEDVPVTTLRV